MLRYMFFPMDGYRVPDFFFVCAFAFVDHAYNVFVILLIL